MSSYKRSRSNFEADLQARESPYVAYGTPLPPLDSEVRDDGSFVPIWKQEVTDERGRKRLHGAFTGGFSAGYFNTVGSKEGWTPSTFLSSRSNRRKDEQKQQKAEDFMDEEDFAEQEAAQQLQANENFAGFGTTAEDAGRRRPVLDLFRREGETMGVKLLKRMGWREGQGIGPRIRRKVRHQEDAENDDEEHSFAPDDTEIVSVSRKDDRRGLGFTAGEKLESNPYRSKVDAAAEDDDDDDDGPLPSDMKGAKPAKKGKPRKGGFGIGVLNDTGSDDEDPYAMGPSISYNKMIGGDKKKAKAKAAKPANPTTSANPLIGSKKPTFRSLKLSSISGFRKCHDGRLPLDGFLLADPLNSLSISDDSDRYPIPEVPASWVSSKLSQAPTVNPDTYQSTAETAKASTLDPKSRAALLGEAQLPGKSIFDYLSPAARAKIASASGRQDLPAARNEAIPSTDRTHTTPLEDLPTLDHTTASAALGRSVGGWMPYAEDEGKRDRYRAFLEYHAKAAGRETLPPRPPELKHTEWVKELKEFAHAARVFRPVSGAMASRFQSASAGVQSSTRDEDEKQHLETAKPKDPAEEAAALDMYGPLTRSTLTFYPTRLVCKRFNVKVPAHVTTSNEGTASHAEGEGREERSTGTADDVISNGLVPGSEGWGAGMGGLMKSFAKGGVEHGKHVEMAAEEPGGIKAAESPAVVKEKAVQDVERNEALEAQKAGEDLFKAVFGDDSD